jgi:hypothetical protein
MSSQVRGLIRNFIWGGKEAPTRAKVRWETLALPIAHGGLWSPTPSPNRRPC